MAVENDIGPDCNIHHTANLWGCTVGDGTRIGAFCDIGRGVVIGKRCRIQGHVFIPPGVTIGDDVFVGPGAIFTNDRYLRRDGHWTPASTVVEDRARIAAGAMIMPVRIGPGALVGMGAVVTRDVAPGVTVVGNPAKVVSAK